MKMPAFIVGMAAAGMGGDFAEIEKIIPPSGTVEERLDFLVITAAGIRARFPETPQKDAVAGARMLLELEDAVAGKNREGAA